MNAMYLVTNKKYTPTSVSVSSPLILNDDSISMLLTKAVCPYLTLDNDGKRCRVFYLAVITTQASVFV